MVIIFGPLLLILAVGLAFNNAGNYKIRIGFYFPEYTDLSGTILESLEDNNFYIELIKDENACIQAVKTGEVNICLIFNRFIVNQSMDNKLQIYVDNSQVNLAWLVTDTVSSHVGKVSSNLTTTFSENLLNRIDVTTQKLTQQRDRVSAIITSQASLKDDIEQLEMLMQDQDLSVDEKLSFAQIKDRSDDLHQHVGFLVTRINNNLNQIESRVKDSNLSEDTEENITSIITDTEEAVMDRDESIAEQHEELKEAVDELDAALMDLRQSLSDSDQARTDAVDKAQDIIDKLRTNLNQLTSHQAALDTMITTLSGIEIRNAQDIAVPIKTELKPLTSDQNHLNYLIPTLIMLFIMLIGLFLSSNLVIIEKKSDAFLRNFITPTRNMYFIIGTFITSFVLIFSQVLIILFVTSLLLDLPISNLFNLSMVVMMAAILFILLGLAIGYIFKSDEAVTLASISLGSIFLLLSGLILPLESMHETIMVLAQYNPLVVSVGALKQVILFNQGFGEIWTKLALLLVYSLVMLAVIAVLQIKVKRKDLPNIR
ncbi:MAG: ABC transporter permease [Nanobdellota archaeon]